MLQGSSVDAVVCSAAAVSFILNQACMDSDVSLVTVEISSTTSENTVYLLFISKVTRITDLGSFSRPVLARPGLPIL